MQVNRILSPAGTEIERHCSTCCSGLRVVLNVPVAAVVVGQLTIGFLPMKNVKLYYAKNNDLPVASVVVEVVVVVVDVVVGSVVVVDSDADAKKEIVDRKLLTADLIVPKLTVPLALSHHSFLLIILSGFQI